MLTGALLDVGGCDDPRDLAAVDHEQEASFEQEIEGFGETQIVRH